MTTHHPPAYPSPGAHPGIQSAPSPMLPGPSVHQGPAASDCGCGQGPAQTPHHSGDPNAPMHAAAAGYGAGYDPYGAYGTYDGYGPAGYLPAPQYASGSFLGINFQDGQFWKGAVLGAAITLLVTNESIQRGLIKGAAKLYGAVQGGVQEIKEKFEDVQAEMHQRGEKQ